MDLVSNTPSILSLVISPLFGPDSIKVSLALSSKNGDCSGAVGRHCKSFRVEVMVKK